METYYVGNLDDYNMFSNGFLESDPYKQDLADAYQIVMRSIFLDKQEEPDNWYLSGKAYGILYASEFSKYEPVYDNN